MLPVQRVPLVLELERLAQQGLQVPRVQQVLQAQQARREWQAALDHKAARAIQAALAQPDPQAL